MIKVRPIGWQQVLYAPKVGFFVIEFLIYLALFSMLALAMLHFVLHSTLFLRAKTMHFCQTVDLYSALDILTNILKDCPIQKNDYKCISQHAIVWYDAHLGKDQGIIFNEGLYLVRGHYGQGKWQKKRRNLILKSLKDIRMNAVVSADTIQAFVIQLQATQNINRIICLKAGGQ